MERTLEMETTAGVLGEVVEAIKSEAVELALKKVRDEPYRFNLFALCGVDSKESVHSRFIAALLDPKGSHGFGSAFLESFLARVNVKVPTDFKKVNVSLEHWGGDAGRFDIYLSAPDWHVIIENKIYASEGDRQLARYAEWLEAETSGYRRLLFLTLDGRESETADGASYGQLSYSLHIYPWIENCIQIAARAPFVRETLCQYQWTIKNLVGIGASPKVYSRENIFARYSCSVGFLKTLRDIPEWYAWMIDRAALQIVLDFGKVVEPYGFMISDFIMKSDEKYARFYVDPVGGGVVRINFEFSAVCFCGLSSGLYWRDKDALTPALRGRGLDAINGKKNSPHWLTCGRVVSASGELQNWDESFLSKYLTDGAFKDEVLAGLESVFRLRRDERKKFYEAIGGCVCDDRP